MRTKIKADINFRYLIRNPSAKRGDGKRATFAIEKRVFDPGTWKYACSESPDLDEVQKSTLKSINARFKDGKLDLEQARKEIEELVSSLYKGDRAIQAVVFNQENRKVLEEYLEAVYPVTKRKKMSDFRSAKNESASAVEALGSVSLQSSSPAKIQDQVDKSCSGNSNKQRRVIFKLRGILNWLRPAESWKHLLTPDNKEHRLVRHVSKTEFEDELVELLPSNRYKVLARVCFYLGCRIGEAMALTTGDLREKVQTVMIMKQITKEGHAKRTVKNKTKNKKNRIAYIFPQGIPALKEWFKIKDTFTTEDRRRAAEVMTAACVKAFTNEESKHMTWHDLRHCYAIRCLDSGMSISDVAKNIGDSILVCEEHYTGFITSDARMEKMVELGNAAD